MTDNEFSRCIKLYRKNVTEAALCVVRNPADAEDIAQEVFLKLFLYTKDFNSDEHIKAWLIRCAINLAIDLKRSYWHRNYTPLSSLGEQTDSGSPSPSVMPERMLLDEKLRITMYLHYCAGYTIKETAAILKVSTAAVRYRLDSGRKKLKNELPDERI